MSEDEKEQESQHDGLTENHFDSERDATVNHSDKTLNHSDSDDDGGPGRGRTQAPTGYDVGGPIKVGALILGRYEVLSELGRGGMGVVYRCFDKIGGTEVAVKSLPPEVSHSEYDMEDVKDNYALVSKLVHQNIATYKTLEKDSEGDYYVVMEYVQGEELRRWMRRKRREGELTLETVLPVLRQVAEALDFAHHKKVIHRDVKPANVMVESDGTVKILDFGLAAQIRTSFSHVSNAVTGKSGTRQYMSTEQWRGQPQGAAADQYALAAMAYEMLGGRVPFDNEDPGVLREIVLKEQPPCIEEMPKSVNEALARGLAKDAKQRFASCLEFVSALEKAGKAEITETAQTAGKKEPVANVPPVVTPQPPPVQPPKVQPIARQPVEPPQGQPNAISQKSKQTQPSGNVHVKQLVIGLAVVMVVLGVGLVMLWEPREHHETANPSVTNTAEEAAETIATANQSVTESAGKGIEYKTINLPGGVELKMVKIKPGSFTNTDVNKTFTLTRDYWLGVYEVTQEQYKAVMGNNPSFNDKGGKYPVETVKWTDADAFCRKLNEKCEAQLPKGYRFDLPTEAQWEYACRAGTTTDYHFGNGIDSSKANYDHDGALSERIDRKDTTREVGSYQPNAGGLYEMHGNVMEWCRDWYDSDWSHNPETLAGMEISGERVLRGGGWRLLARGCRSAYRRSGAPSDGHNDLGFRVALVPVQ
ncbi:MAG: SUMF1/EgtB/PvdO family nonheme iron enzyme [Victivallales bacterium]|nr:SUMF1/EgtB/PvdO family nonheme iron enzyme [Victivallales bacterium]